MITQLATLLAQNNNEGGSIFGLLILLVPLGAILYMTVVPQRKARQRQADMLRKIDVGDEILTTGGIVGVITFIEDDLYHLEVDNDVVIRIAKTAVARTTAEPDPASQPASRTRRGLLGSGSAAKDTDASDAEDRSAGGDDDK